MLAHANHFVSPVALVELRDIGVASTPCSLYRDLRVCDLLLPHPGHITAAHVKAALFDDFGTPFSVCRPLRMNESGNHLASVAMIVMEQAMGMMDIAMLPASNRCFSRTSLNNNAPAQLLAAE